MNKPVFRVVGLDNATCEADYCGTETSTKPMSLEMMGPKLFAPSETGLPTECVDTVSVRIRDIMPALRQSETSGLGWINDFADDPVVITRDLYDVLLTYQRLKRAA